MATITVERSYSVTLTHTYELEVDSAEGFARGIEEDFAMADDDVLERGTFKSERIERVVIDDSLDLKVVS